MALHTYWYSRLAEALNEITASHPTPEVLRIVHTTARAYQKPARSQYSLAAIRAAYTTAYPRGAARPMPITQAMEILEADQAVAYRPSGLFAAMYRAQDMRRSIREGGESAPLAERFYEYPAKDFWEAFKKANYRLSPNVYERRVIRGPNARATTRDWGEVGYYFTIPVDWSARVRMQGLAVVDGLLTLDATRLDTRGHALYAATWGRQDRGVSISSERGYIAYDHVAHIGHHSSTATLAVKGLSRKLFAFKEVTK